MSGPWLPAPLAPCALCGRDTRSSVRACPAPRPQSPLSPGCAQDGGAWPGISYPGPPDAPSLRRGLGLHPPSLEPSPKQWCLSAPGRVESRLGVQTKERPPRGLGIEAPGPSGLLLPPGGTGSRDQQVPQLVGDAWVLGPPSGPCLCLKWELEQPCLSSTAGPDQEPLTRHRV